MAASKTADEVTSALFLSEGGPINRSSFGIAWRVFRESTPAKAQMVTPATSLFRDFALRARARVVTLSDEPIGDVVLEDVAHILNGFATDTLRRDPFDVPEPHVGIESAPTRLPAKLPDARRSGVVRGERHQSLVERIHRLVLVVLVHHEPDVFDSRVDVGLDFRDVADGQFLPRRRHHLH